jgi:hypothetical protein
MSNRTVAALPVPGPAAPADADGSRRRVFGAAPRSRRRVLGAAALVVLVALPSGLQINLIYARRDLGHVRAAGREARADVRAQRSLVSASELTLTGAKADEAAAATEVELARTQLATTGVAEHEIVRVRDETQVLLDGVVAQKATADALFHQQELDLPAAKECVLEGNRGLMRAAASPPCPVAWPAATGVG